MSEALEKAKKALEDAKDMNLNAKRDGDGRFMSTKDAVRYSELIVIVQLQAQIAQAEALERIAGLPATPPPKPPKDKAGYL